ncbi:MAG: hypothetical protein Athens101426_592 [Parcubacteria group bacterium Athens1014_26]|nr:MAG: hypothetical protein Athens101426_592 [Parcubacteria group bacterium Athens1014_26]
MNPAQKIESASTQQFIEIESIENGVVKLKGGGLRKILLVSGMNFDLKSEEEQGIIIYAFQGFLNSLDFSAQIFIHSRKININSYLQKLKGREDQEPNELLKSQISEYQSFIKSFVSENAIMEKTFFLVIPYDPIQMPKAGANITDAIKGLLGVKKTANTEEKNTEERIEQLEQRVDQVNGGLNQIGLRAVPINDTELIELFYNLYNPESVERKGLGIAQK